jgi:hypothetical protein
MGRGRLWLGSIAVLVPVLALTACSHERTIGLAARLNPAAVAIR